MKAPAIFLTCENCGRKIDISGKIYPVRIFKDRCDRAYPHIAPCCCADCAEELIEKQLDDLYLDFKRIQNQRIESMDCKKYIGGTVPEKTEQHSQQRHVFEERFEKIGRKVFQKGFAKLPIRRT